MKQTIAGWASVAAILILNVTAYGQSGVGINSTGAAAHSSSMLDVSSTSKGALLPRMTAVQRTAIASPATGLTVYQTDGVAGYYYYDGSSWVRLSTTVGTVTGVTASSPLSSSGGAAPDISLSGVVDVANGGSGASSLTGYLKGNGVSAFTGSATIPGSDVSGNISGNAAGFTGSLAGDVGGTQSATTIGTGKVTSSHILDGTIVNADVNASAGISLSKLAALTANRIAITDGSGILSAGTAGTTTTVLHGNAAGAPTYSAVSLTADVSGTLPVANGGTGATTLTGVLKGNGTGAISAMTGTANYAARWTDVNTIGIGMIRDDATTVGINSAPSATERLTVTGTGLNGAVGTTTLITGYGLAGNNSGTAGANTGYGVFGQSNQAGGAPVYGLNANTTTTPTGSFPAAGVIGQSNNTAGTGVIGSGNAGGYTYFTAGQGGAFTSSNIGAVGFGSGTGSYGLYGANNATAGTGLGFGIYGTTGQRNVTAISATVPISGVFGYNSNGSLSGQSVGVCGNYSGSGYGSGVAGLGFGGTWVGTIANDIGVTGIVGTAGQAGVAGFFGTHTAVSSTAGVYGQSSSSATAAVRATNTTGATGLGLAVGGTFTATGTKSAVVPTSKGYQKLYCNESPEVWFEDYGVATLNNGQATVQLDPLFLETVTIDNSHPMLVFLQEQGESNGLIVTPNSTSFTVKEKSNGTSNIRFAYRIMAKRKYYQDYRFGNDVTMGEQVDWSLYKDVPAIPVNYNEAVRVLNYSTEKPVKTGNAEGANQDTRFRTATVPSSEIKPIK